MLCQVCKKREVNVHFKEIIGGEVRELHLCDVCAKEKGLGESFFPGFSLPELMLGLTKLEIPPSLEKGPQCSGCGISYEEIIKKGKLGCSLCYQNFTEYLDPLLEKIHGKVYHSGKVPKEGKKEDRLDRKVYELRKKLEEAVRKEEYEKAAEFRDELRELEKGGRR